MSRSASARRQAATLPWSPDSSTSGIGAALEELRPGVLRIFEQALGEALLGPGGLLAHDAGQQPHAGIDQRQRRDLAARQHEVAERDLLEARAPSITRSSTPSNRPHTMIAPGAGGKLRDAPLRQRLPRAATSAGAAGPRRAASIARASTSAFITMPGPPPAGVSSTVRCLSVA